MFLIEGSKCENFTRYPIFAKEKQQRLKRLVKRLLGNWNDATKNSIADGRRYNGNNNKESDGIHVSCALQEVMSCLFAPKNLGSETQAFRSIVFIYRPQFIESVVFAYR